MSATRSAILLAGLVLGPALAAQDVVADTTAPSAYYPLHVGDAWQFVAFYRGLPILESREIRGDTVVAGVAYVTERTCDASVRSRTWRCDPDRAVRFDSASTDIRSLRATDGMEDVLHCALGADFGAEVPCRGTMTRYSGRYGGSVQIRDQTVPVPALKTEELPVDPAEPPFASGVGPTPRDVDGPYSSSAFLYAFVDGERHGYAARLDPEPPTRYQPLAVGNAWEYRLSIRGVDIRSGQAIVADSLVGETRYLVRREFRETALGIEETTALVRYDSLSSVVHALQSDGREAWVSCPFGTPYVLTLPTCPDPNLSTREQVGVFGHAVSPGIGIMVGGRTAPMTSFKTFVAQDGTSVRYGAGIGRLPQTSFPDCSSGCSEEMTYLRLVQPDGSVREWGTQDLTVADERRADLPALTLTASPNPASATFALAVTVGEPAEILVEVFDARGRRVEARTVRVAGAVSLSLDASAWARGLYLVRATDGARSVTARVVRP